MGLDKIQHEIMQNAKQSAKQLHSQAEQQSEQILDQAKQHAKMVLEQAEREAAEANKLAELERFSAVEVTSRNQLLEAANEVIERSAGTLRRPLIWQMSKHAAYSKLFKRVAEQSKTIAPQSELIAAVRKADHDIAAKAGFRNIEHADINGGLIVYTKDKRAAINATLENLVDQNQQTIKAAVRKQLSSHITGVQPAIKPEHMHAVHNTVKHRPKANKHQIKTKARARRPKTSTKTKRKR